MPASFPLNPVDGQEYVLGTKTYIWSESKGIWELLLDGSGLNLTNLITNITPSADNTYNIGTTTQQWKNLHISGSLFLDGAEITANQDGSVNLPAGAQIVADIPETLLDLNITDGSQGQVLVTSGQGTFSFADKIGLGSFSVDTSATNSGAGGLSYNGATGVFTFTKPDLSSYSTFSGDYADLANKPSIPQSITALSDVDTTGASDGEILQYNAFAGRWESVSNSGGIDLTAFSISTQDATDTPTLSYNNTTGVFTYTPPDISEFITKADISVGTAGAASGAGGLSYNSTSGVFTYTPPDLDSFVTDVSLALDDLTDVAASTPADGQVLKWNNASSQWVPRADNSGIALDDLSVTVNAEPSGAGNLLYNNSSGVFTLTKPDLSPYATSASLATVATSGSYNDLTDTPSIPTAIEDLGNVTIQTDEQQLPELVDGQVLTWDDTAQYWTNANNTAIALGDLSVTANAVPSGDGAIDYDNTTGEFQFVPPEIPRDVNELNDADGLLSGPIIISVSPTEFDGNTGTTFTIRGGNLKSGANILFKDSNDSYWTAGTTTFLSSSEITATTPKDFTVADGPLGIRYEFGTASTEITNIISTGALPYWQTASGQLLSVNQDDTISVDVVAVDPDGSPITYALVLGSLPPDCTLSSSGRISGTAPSSNDPITYTFTIRATDVGGNFVDQQFSIFYEYFLPYTADYKTNWEDISSSLLITASTTTVSNYTANYHVWTSAPSKFAANRFYFMHRVWYSVTYQNDVPIAAIQHYDKNGTMKNNWNFANGTHGFQTSNQHGAGFLSPASTLGVTVWESIPSSAGGVQESFRRAISTGSSRTGAQGGISQTQGAFASYVDENTDKGGLYARSSVSYDPMTLYIFSESSGSAINDKTYLRKDVSIAVGDYFAIALQITVPATGSYTPPDRAMYFAIAD